MAANYATKPERNCAPGASRDSAADTPFRPDDKPLSSGLYTPAQRARRDSTIWTPIQGFLAAGQFFVFLISLALVLHFLVTGDGLVAASVSVMVKTAVLLTIMVTGAIWEKVVFGQYLFAPVFFWEDVISMLVIALHLLYVAAFVFGFGSAAQQMVIALAAYAAYVINAGQFLLKLRRARLEAPTPPASKAQAPDGARAPQGGAA